MNGYHKYYVAREALALDAIKALNDSAWSAEKVTIKGCGKAESVIRAEGTTKYKPAEKKISITVSPKKTKLKSVT